MATFEEALSGIAQRVRDYQNSLETEEATKNALVMPFIASVLGYDVFDPSEVVPEFTCDVGMKRGEKVDYAIMREGKVEILIEAKCITSPLNLAHANQLVRYFSVADARIGVLTNGQQWEFYTDLDKSNIMDSRPFLKLDLLAPDPALLSELKKMTKESFDIDSVLKAAEELKYISAIKQELAQELENPSADFVRLFAKRVYDGNLSSKMSDFFTTLTRKSLRGIINDKVNERLKAAMRGEEPDELTPSPAPEEQEEPDEKYETTDEERQGYFIIKAILGAALPVERVFYRDRAAYCAIILDDNQRKTVCRLFFNSSSSKSVAFMNPDGSSEKVRIESLDDLYHYSDRLVAIAKSILGETTAEAVNGNSLDQSAEYSHE